MVFYLCVGTIAVLGFILLVALHKSWSGSILGFAMACSNTFGLVTGAFLLGFGLIEIPRGIWKNADWINRQKVLSHKVAKMALKLDDAHQEFSNAIVVAQATSNQMSKRDPLRPYMNVIDDMLQQMLRSGSSFKPQGGRLGQNDMDYDTDEKTMAGLRRQLRIAREKYYREKSEYMNVVFEALELEDTVKNYEQRVATGWKYVSALRNGRTGSFGSALDTIEFIWRCLLRKELEKLLALTLGCMSVAILLAEATILPRGVDLSLFSILINAAGREEVLVQVAAFVPLMYMCVCTYYSLFKIGMLMFYSLTPKQTSSVSLLMICSMVARYAPPISYNFLNLIHLDGDKKTIFEKRMGNIDDAVPFFGNGFNKIYPLIMVIYTIIIATNFFDRVINYVGNCRIFKLQDEVDDTDGFDPSGMVILQKERHWLRKGYKVGEQVIPLARNFNDTILDSEEEINDSKNSFSEMNATNTSEEEDKRAQLKPLREAHGKSSRDVSDQRRAIFNKRPSEQATILNALEESKAKHIISEQTSRLASRWESMKNGFQSFKAKMEAKKFLSSRQIQEKMNASSTSLPQSLDEIFERLKRPAQQQTDDAGDDDENDI